MRRQGPALRVQRILIPRPLGTQFRPAPPRGLKRSVQVGEQATMFLYDPSGNALEFKAFKDPSRLFAK